VHAFAQVVSFDTECDLPIDVLKRALNYELPRDMAALAVEESPGFHARRDSTRKRYRYIIHDGPVRDVFRRRFAWQIFTRLDVPAMQRAAKVLVGKHDFASFESSGSERETTERTVFGLDVCRRPIEDNSIFVGSDFLPRTGPEDGAPLRNDSLTPDRESIVQIEVECDGFLYNMVRIIAGTLVEIGQGKRPEMWIAEVLAAEDRRRAGMTAPPQGLFLVRVEY
jgi:tRNA pseudouridine38-40 synthase